MRSIRARGDAAVVTHVVKSVMDSGSSSLLFQAWLVAGVSTGTVLGSLVAGGLNARFKKRRVAIFAQGFNVLAICASVALRATWSTS